MDNIDATIIQKFLDDRMIVVVVVLYVIGVILKKSPMKDWMIPLVLMAISIIFAIVMIGLTPMAVIQGILAAALTVYANQSIKQLTDKRK